MTTEHKIGGALVRGMTVVALFAALAGVVRVGQDAAIAWRFGTGPLVDAYYFVLSLANWPVTIALSAFTWLVAPADAARLDPAAAPVNRFRAELLGATMILAAISLPLAWVIMQTIADSAAGGLEYAAAAQAEAGIPQLVAAVPLGIIGALLSAWFVAGGRHSLTLVEALPPLTLMAIVLMIPGQVLFWGTSAGVAVQLLAMVLILRRASELPAPRLGFSSSAWAHFSRAAVPMLIGQVLFSFVPVIDALFAARLGDGAMSALSYANRLILGLLGLTGLALQRAGLPLLSRLSAHSPDASLRIALRWALYAAAGGTALALVVTLLSVPVVSLLFERGSFTAADSERVANLLRYGTLQLPAFLGGITLVTALASVQASRSLALIAAAGLAAKMVSNAILVPLHGTTGVQISTAIMYATTALIAWLMLRRRLRRMAPGPDDVDA